MKIAHDKDVNVAIFDIECLREMFHIGFYNPDTKEWGEFEISAFKNDLYAFVKFYTKNNIDYFVSFNGISYDHQILQFVVSNHEKWFDLTSLEITRKISDFSQEVIENQNYGINPTFREPSFSVKAIDLYKIHHFDNDARKTSLKWCEFMLNMDVEEMPIHHHAENLTKEDLQTIKDYEKKDILATLALFYLTLGDLQKVEELLFEIYGFPIFINELNGYKGKNKIQDRFDVQKETGLDCLNWSDVKIGEEWNKLDYKLAENIRDDLKLIPTKVKYPYGQKFKNFFPKTMDFKTPLLQEFIKNFGNEYVKNIKQEFHITIGSTRYTIAKGGIHSTEKNRQIICQPGWILRDADVGSQYPNSIVKLEIFAPHLKRTILNQYNEKIDRRIRYKIRAGELKKEGNLDEARTYSSVQEMLKLCLNGGYYGKLGQQGSFLEYPEGLLKVCIGNQIEILMIIEMMESEGISVVSGNTDGFVSYFPAEKEEIYKRICAEWEKKVGNDKMGKLEYTDFQCLWQDNINSYIGKKSDGSVKKKSGFVTEFELNKNKSKRVVQLALEEYFINQKDPIEFIKNHKNIFDFCIAKKASGKMHYEEISEEKTIIHKKLIRYYISKNGNIMMKRGFNYEGKPVNNHCEAIDADFPWTDQPKVTYFNKFFFSNDYKINYDYYILEVLKRIDAICKTKKAVSYAEKLKPQIQISLF